MGRKTWELFGIAALVLSITAATASADLPAEYYKGKQVSIIVGDTAGSSYVNYAQLVQRHLGRFLPGEPQVIVRLMPGAAGIVAANYLAEVAPKDGTTIGALYRGTGSEPLMYGSESKLKADPRKYAWLYSLNSEVSLMVAWHETGITSFNDVLSKELLVAIAGTAGDAGVFGSAMNGIMGTKLKMICCYGGSAAQDLAMERGEIGGRLNFSWAYLKISKPDWLKEGKIKLLAQLALAKHAELPDLPLVLDLVKDPEDRKIMEIVLSRQTMGRPYAAPPGVSADVAAALRGAFDKLLQDKEFKADAEKSKIEINQPMPGAEINALIDRMFSVSPETVRRLRASLKPDGRKDVVVKEGSKPAE
jgi:tripartite-type tricarboxylate transporter receptor subunit TctC